MKPAGARCRLHEAGESLVPDEAHVVDSDDLYELLLVPHSPQSSRNTEKICVQKIHVQKIHVQKIHVQKIHVQKIHVQKIHIHISCRSPINSN
ncbi:uncharacterized protein V6R79_006435 [Siganus canaliculatus]